MILRRKPKGEVKKPREKVALRIIELESGAFLIEKDETMTSFLNRNWGVI